MIPNHSVIVSPTEPTGNNRKKVWMQKGKNLVKRLILGEIRNFLVGDIPSIVNSTTRVIMEGLFTYVEGGTSITASIASGYQYAIYICDENKQIIYAPTSYSNTTMTINLPDNAKYIFVRIKNDEGTDIAESELDNIKFMITYGTDETDYEKYIEPKIYIKNDNGIYEEFIKKSEDEIYSTREVRIGTWIDGKPLYRKVVEYTPTTIIGETGKVTDIYIPHKISNFKQLCGQKCITSDGYILPLLGSKTETTLDYGTCIRAVTEGTINLRLVNDSFGIRTWYITLEYTKTTD